MSKEVRKIKVWRAKELYISNNIHNLDKNYYPLIIRDIESVGFPQLQIIYLWGNNIEAVEGLSQLRAPALTVLRLGNNYII